MSDDACIHSIFQLGSYAKGVADDDSDVDLLASFLVNKSLHACAGAQSHGNRLAVLVNLVQEPFPMTPFSMWRGGR